MDREQRRELMTQKMIDEANMLASEQEHEEAYGSMEKFTKLMVDDVTTPQDIKDVLWGFFHKDVIIGKLSRDDREKFENRLTIARNLLLMSKPGYTITIPQILNMENAQNIFSVKCTRGEGGFERTALTTQIRQFITSSMEKEKRGGILSGFGRLFGFKKRERAMGEVR